MDMVPADCDAGDLLVEVSTRKVPGLDTQDSRWHFRFDSSGARLEPATDIRVAEGLSDAEFARALEELPIPPHIRAGLAGLSPCDRYKVAVTNDDDVLRNRHLRPEHREWMVQIRAHALSRKHDA